MGRHIQIKSQERNLSVDVFRLFAGFCIVFLHVGYDEFNPQIVELVRLWGRWCVPFFFMLSGYFLQKKLMKLTNRNAELLKQIFKILKITCVVNLVFILSELLTKGEIDWRSLFPAAHYHLWFLPSLCLGSFAVYLQCSWHIRPQFVLGISALVILSILGLDSYRTVLGLAPDNVSGKVMPFLSIPFMFLGSYFAKKKYQVMEKPIVGLVLIFVGFSVQIVEANFILESSGKPILELQFLLGTVIHAIGFFIVAFSVDVGSDWLSKWGRVLSLFIYLYHPLLILVFYRLGANSVFSPNLQLIFPVVVFFATFFLGVVLKNRYRNVFSFLNGDFFLGKINRLRLLKAQS